MSQIAHVPFILITDYRHKRKVWSEHAASEIYMRVNGIVDTSAVIRDENGAVTAVDNSDATIIACKRQCSDDDRGTDNPNKLPHLSD